MILALGRTFLDELFEQVVRLHFGGNQTVFIAFDRCGWSMVLYITFHDVVVVNVIVRYLVVVVRFLNGYRFNVM